MTKKSASPSLPQSPFEKILTTSALSYTVCSYLLNEDILNLSSITSKVYQSMNTNNIFSWVLLSKEKKE